MSGWRLLLTRPEEECAALAQRLAEAGIASSSLPLLAIEPLALDEQAKARLQALHTYQAIIVVSKPAARLVLQQLREAGLAPPRAGWFTVGEATAGILEQADLDVTVPAEGDDSEALLRLPALQAALTGAAPRVLIVRGVGGRELLAERLAEQGASVDYLELYRRRLPDYPRDALVQRIEAERLNGLVVSSGQGFEHLLRQAGEQWPGLSQLTLFVPSPRVAEQARAAGAQQVVDCRGASAAALLAAVQRSAAPASQASDGIPQRPHAKDGYVSETVLSNNEQPKAPETPKAATTAPAPAPVKRAGNGLALLALLVGVAGVAVGGWGVWQVQQLQGNEQGQAEHLQALNQRADALQQRQQQLGSNLQSLPAASELEDRRRLVAQLQGDQQRLSQRLDTVLGQSRKAWRLAEAEHLLRLATLRLTALQDIASATALVEGADQILREQSDPGAFAAREQLAKSLAVLNSTEQPDRTGLFLKLAAQRELVQQLSAVSPDFDSEANAVGALTAEGDITSRLSRWWGEMSKYFQVEFNADQNVRPLLAGQSLNQLRLALSLTLEQAQWAALNGQAEVYTQALDDARSVLLANFNADNPQSKAMLESLNALADQPVSVQVPDLSASLAALQTYIQRRAPTVEGEGDTP